MTRSENAFTLLEVLAAVALLGILYTVLAGVAMQGLRGEGIARRRMLASLLADERLSEMERELVMGVAPPIGTDEDEQDEFRITVEVSPFEPPEGLFEDPKQAEDAPDAPDLPSLLDLGIPDQAAVIVSIELEVSWEEGDQTLSVQRSTFGYDLAALSAVLPVPQAEP